MSHGHEHARYGSWFLDRRRLLQIGGLGFLGLNLAQLFEAEEAQAAHSPAPRSVDRIQPCILLYYYAAPSHIDTWDMKPNAPREVRGLFRPIATRVPGVQVCEHLSC